MGLIWPDPGIFMGMMLLLMPQSPMSSRRPHLDLAIGKGLFIETNKDQK